MLDDLSRYSHRVAVSNESGESQDVIPADTMVVAPGERHVSFESKAFDAVVEWAKAHARKMERRDHLGDSAAVAADVAKMV